MRLSIFSFKKIDNTGGWGSTLGFALVLYLVSLFSWEFYISTLYSNSHSKLAVKNSYELWAKARQQATDYGDCAVILTGASRLQMAIDLDVMKKFAHGYPIQLSIYGGNFLIALEELANDEKITGTVIVSVNPGHLTDAFDLSLTSNWTRRYTNETNDGKTAFYDPLEQTLSLFLDENFLFRQEGAKPGNIFNDLKINQYTFMDRERRIHADFSLIDEKKAYESKLEKYIGPDPKLKKYPQFEDILKRILVAVDIIQARSGHVILFRPPSTRGILAGEKILYPRELMWDKLAEKTTARTIHFADYPELTQFHHPDGVHLDYRDAAKYTEALSKIIFDDSNSKPQCLP